jgi:hypothetical protein
MERAVIDMPDRQTQLTTAINGALVKGSAVALSTILPESASVLPPALQDLARTYIAARGRVGGALLDMAAAIHTARQAAAHGEWLPFLAAIELSPDQAERMIRTHARAINDVTYADAVRRDFLSASAAALLAQPSTPQSVIDDVLSQPTPPTHRQITTAIKDAKSATLRHLNAAPPTHAAAAELRDRVEALGGDFDPDPDAHGRFHVTQSDGHELRGTIAELRPIIANMERAITAEPLLIDVIARADAAGMTVTQSPGGTYRVSTADGAFLAASTRLIDIANSIDSYATPPTDTPIADVATPPIDLTETRIRLRHLLERAMFADDETAEGVAALALGCVLLGLRSEMLSEVLDDETFGALVTAIGGAS